MSDMHLLQFLEYCEQVSCRRRVVVTIALKFGYQHALPAYVRLTLGDVLLALS